MWQRTVVIGIGSCVAIGGAVTAMGHTRWNAGTTTMREQLLASRLPLARRVVRLDELPPLPPPVQRYFGAVLMEGQPLVTTMRMTQAGSMNMSATKADWRNFTASQWVTTRRPGFDWDARIRMMPGAAAHVHDAYIDGEGILLVKLLGLVTVAEARGTPAAARGELLRYLAEGPWYPTALLPSDELVWTPVDDSSARVTLTDRGIVASVVFSFDANGLISAMRADARDRVVDGVASTLPWTGRFWNYAEREGMRVPLDGEVAWVLPEGPATYWRGHVTSIGYEMTN